MENGRYYSFIGISYNFFLQILNPKSSWVVISYTQTNTPVFTMCYVIKAVLKCSWKYQRTWHKGVVIDGAVYQLSCLIMSHSCNNKYAQIVFFGISNGYQSVFHFPFSFCYLPNCQMFAKLPNILCIVCESSLLCKHWQRLEPI